MNESFGTRLRRQRERQHLTLASIADVTKIGASLLEALERDDVSHWPPGIFRRAFVRAYAEAIGLDADAVVREFLSRFPENGDQRPSAAATPDLTGVPPTPLRLTLGDERSAIPAWQVLAQLHQRWKAVAFDLGMVFVATLSAAVVFDQVWMPLGIVALGYYAVGVLMLGNTAGTALFDRRVKSAVQGRLQLIQGSRSFERARPLLVTDADPNEAASQVTHRAAG
jgi:transcriptional regulator with XRE-family HTH domain